MKAVFVDTAPLIYLMESARPQRDAVRVRLAAWIDAGVPLHSSVLTLTELLVPAKRAGDASLTHQYKSALRDLLSGPLLVIDEYQAEWAAELRARYAFQTPDALQLVSALTMGCDIFFTNDRALQKCRELQVILADE